MRSMGGGAETVASGLRLSTALRYTRWAKDAYSYNLQHGVQGDYARTNVNAVELIFGVGF